MKLKQLNQKKLIVKINLIELTFLKELMLIKRVQQKSVIFVTISSS